MTIERRRHLRYQIPDHSFVVLGTSPRRMGQLVNICRNGLAFRYLVESGEPALGPDFMDIFCTQHGFYLSALPFTEVSERLENVPPFSSVATKIKGVQFKELTPLQQSRLEEFIRQNGSL